MTTYQHPSPTEKESAAARASKQALAERIQSDQPLILKLSDEKHPTEIELPATAVTMLLEILETMAAGQGITLIPDQTELTTGQVAQILNVSRPHVVKLLDEGQIPHHKVGTHRRVLMQDVMRYKQEIDAQREAVLDQLVAEAQEQDMGYE